MATLGLSIYDVLGRRAYAAVMATSTVPVRDLPGLRPGANSIAVLVLPAAFDRGAEAWAMPETLKTAWLYLHVSMIVLGYTAFFLTFAAGLLYLLQERELKSRRPRAAARRI